MATQLWLICKSFNISFLSYRCFGKLSEDVRKREDIHVLRSARLFERRVSRINYVSSTIPSPNTALVRCRKKIALLNKPIFLGACVLDLSKLLMMRHFYRHIKPQFDREGSNLTLQMTNTGAVILEIPNYHIISYFAKVEKSTR